MRGLRVVVIGLAGLLVAIQLVPYGRSHANPPVTRDAPWITPEARRIAVAACYDCHSNETQWPWYSHVAPMSWLLQNDVDDGRRELNFSEWDRRQRVDDLSEVVAEGSMPPRSYLLLHQSAKLSDAERRELLAALDALAMSTDDRGGRGRR